MSKVALDRLIRGLYVAVAIIYAFDAGIEPVWRYGAVITGQDIVLVVLVSIEVGLLLARVERRLVNAAARWMSLALTIPVVLLGEMCAETYITHELSFPQFVVTLASVVVAWRETHAWRLAYATI